MTTCSEHALGAKSAGNALGAKSAEQAPGAKSPEDAPRAKSPEHAPRAKSLERALRAKSLERALRALWARSSTLDERLSGIFVPVPGGEAEADERYDAWLALAAESDPRRMARRLAFDGLDEARVRPLLGHVAARAGVALPPEFALLAEVLDATGSFATDAAVDEVVARLPFAEALAPFLRAAQQRLDQALGAGRAAAGPALRLGCLRGLAERLCELAEPTLAQLLESEHALRPEGCYRRAMQRVAAEAGAAFWHDDAALARGLAIAARHWVDASAELLLRLQADADALVQAFGPRAAGAPVALHTGLGDPHRGGRAVARVRFASGLELYYKPRDLSLDLACARLLDQMRRDGVQDDLRLPALLARPGYGWVEGIAARPAADAAEAERYFERGGALLCLAHLLDITDCHSGNLVAAGSHPVLIDLETVCHQRARDLDERYSDAERRARNTLAASVLGTGLLPEARMEGDLRVELGGLSPGSEALVHIEQARWVDLGSDTMRREAATVVAGDGAHQLLLDGVRVSVRAHGESLQRGFVRMARHAMAQREAWCAPEGPLAAFGACDARFVFRGTLVYSALLSRLAAPDLAQQGIDRSLLLEVLARPLLDAGARPAIWPLLAAERAAMAQGDVPHFCTPVAEAVLRVDGAAPIAGYLQGPGLARLRRRILDFGEADLVRELGFLRSALVRPLCAPEAPALAAAAGEAAAAPADTASLRAAAPADRAHLRAAAAPADKACPRAAAVADTADVRAAAADSADTADLLAAAADMAHTSDVLAAAADKADTTALRAAALAFADRLEATAQWGDDGSVTWIDTALDARHDALAWRSLSPWLGDGVAGLALVLAALERAGAGPHASRLRRGAQRHLALGMAQIAAEPIGGLVGAPSVAYALAHVAALTGDRSALALAGTVVRAVPLAAIGADTVLDVAGGVAGTLLCLASVRGISEAAGAASLARAATLRIRACAARLAEAAAAAPGRLLPTVGGRVLTGLSHGQAGFALAIARLRGGDGAAALQPLARAALAFERDHRDPRAGRWLDLRPDVTTPCACAWCHGAAGIGVARAVMRARAAADGDAGHDESPSPWRAARTQALTEDLHLAARATCDEPDAPLDHLCCGSMGLVACTQAMAQALDDPALLAGAQRRAARVLARAQARGGYATVVGASAGVQSLGLFTGLAGVGYAALSLVEPGLPSVLSLH
jgi:lantibiotic modifying enzyme